MPLRVWRIGCPVECPSTGFCLIFSSWLAWSYFRRPHNQVRFLIPLYQDCVLLRWLALWMRWPWSQGREATPARIVYCKFTLLLPFPTLYFLERSDCLPPTLRISWGVSASSLWRCSNHMDDLKFFCTDCPCLPCLCISVWPCGCWFYTLGRMQHPLTSFVA